MSDFQQVVLDRLPRNVNEGELGIACRYAAHAAAISLPGDAGSPPAETCWRSLAFDILRLKDELRALVVEVVWSPELMAAVLAEITRRGQFWTLAIVSLGNISATCDARFCLKLIATAVPEDTPHDERGTETHGTLLADYLVSMLKNSPEDCRQRCAGTGTPVCDSILWIIANIATQGGAASLARLTPLLVETIHKDAAATSPNDSSSQITMRSFRALVAILSSDKRWCEREVISVVEEGGEDEEGAGDTSGNVFHEIDIMLKKWPSIITTLALEYRCGLKGICIPGRNFLPDAHDRALTCSQLAQSRRGRAVLWKADIIQLLVQSIHAKSLRGMATSSRLWASSVAALHSFTFTTDGRRHLMHTLSALPEHPGTGQGPASQIEALQKGLLDIATGRGDVHADLEYSTRSLAADACVALRARWKLERLLWIACLIWEGQDLSTS